MNITYGVAVAYHCSGATPDCLRKERFNSYDEADKFADEFRDECEPTIYLILDEKYVFHCKRSAVCNEPYKIYSLEHFPEGQIEKSIWWEYFIKNPYNFLDLAIDKIQKM
ncbi:MAG: hypothetical protein IKU45_02075 [Clostridia bacterium]|nr:hypothetical protein [Clostridia bacterium]